MSESQRQWPVAVTRVLTTGDVAELRVAGALLDAFNREYADPTPGPEVLATRLAALLAAGDTDVLLVKSAPAVSGDPEASGSDPGTGATWSGSQFCATGPRCGRRRGRRPWPSCM